MEKFKKMCRECKKDYKEIKDRTKETHKKVWNLLVEMITTYGKSDKNFYYIDLQGVTYRCWHNITKISVPKIHAKVDGEFKVDTSSILIGAAGGNFDIYLDDRDLNQLISLANDVYKQISKHEK